MLTQEQFDTVVTHLLTQNQRCLDAHADGCMYRGEFGMKCAIGALIPDHLYQSRFENSNVALRGEILETDDVPERYSYMGDSAYERLLAEAEIRKEIRNAAGIAHDKESRLQAASLQSIHDDNEPDEWPDLLVNFARYWGLKEPQILVDRRLTQAELEDEVA